MDPGRDKIALPLNSEERNLEKHQLQKKKEKNTHLLGFSPKTFSPKKITKKEEATHL